MEYFKVTGSSYEDALRKASKKYGTGLRIHSRRDIRSNGIFGVGKSVQCELTCYLVDVDEEPEKKDVSTDNEEKMFARFEKEAMTPNPDMPISAQSEQSEEKKPEPIDEPTMSLYLDMCRQILRSNDFSEKYVSWCVGEMSEELKHTDADEISGESFELMLLDKIAGSFEVARNVQSSPKRICVIVGVSGSGKTVTVAKLSAIYGSCQSSAGRNVRIVTLDDNPSVVAQYNRLGKALNIDVDVAKHENELSEAFKPRLTEELILVDTCGRKISESGSDYQLYGLMNVANPNATEFIFTVSATMKYSDLELALDMFKPFHLSGMIVTKLDETSTVGNVISISHDRNIPLVFITDGQKIPKDIKPVTVELLLTKLTGFKTDIEKFFKNNSDV